MLLLAPENSFLNARETEQSNSAVATIEGKNLRRQTDKGTVANVGCPRFLASTRMWREDPKKVMHGLQKHSCYPIALNDLLLDDQINPIDFHYNMTT